MHPPTPCQHSLPPLLLVLASAALGFAAEAPVIDRVLDGLGKETAVVSPGGTFEVQGQNLYVPPADPKVKGFPGLKATLGGKPLMTLAATPTSLRFLVQPSQPERKGQPLVIHVGAKSARTKVDVGPTSTGGDPPPTTTPLPFRITSFTSSATPAGRVFRAKGEVKGLLDGMKLGLVLSFRGEEIQSRAVKLAGERFSVTFGPFRERAPVGTYALELTFTLNSQRRSQVREWMRTLEASKRGGEDLALYKSVRRRSYLNLGGTGPEGQILPKDRAAQAAHLRDWALASIAETEIMLTELEEALALAQRIYFRAPGQGSIDEGRYLTWLVDKGHAQDEAAARRLLADTRFASARGELDDQAWLAWIKERILARIRKELAATKVFDGETLCPIDPKVDALILRSQGELLELARSKPLFKRAKLKLPPELNAPGLAVQPRPGATPKALRATLALLRQRVAQ